MKIVTRCVDKRASKLNIFYHSGSESYYKDNDKLEEECSGRETENMWTNKEETVTNMMTIHDIYNLLMDSDSDTEVELKAIEDLQSDKRMRE